MLMQAQLADGQEQGEPAEAQHDPCSMPGPKLNGLHQRPPPPAASQTSMRRAPPSHTEASSHAGQPEGRSPALACSTGTLHSATEDAAKLGGAGPGVKVAQHVSAADILAKIGLLRCPSLEASKSVANLVPAPDDQQPCSGAAAPKKPSRNSRRAHKKLLKAEQTKDGVENCIACWSAPRSIIFQPCGHFCCCTACAHPILHDGLPCPMCRGCVAAGIAVDSPES